MKLKVGSFTAPLLAALLLGCVAAQAQTLVTTRPTGTDSVNWSQLGSYSTSIPNPFSFTTTDGVAGTGSYATATGEVMQQAVTWAGNFASDDYLNWTEGNGPLTLDFTSGYSQIGAQIQEDAYGAFTAELCDAFGCVTEDGDSTSNDDDSAIYIGISSGTSDIDWVTFSLTSSGGSLGNFAINQMTLNGPTSVPEGGAAVVYLLLAFSACFGTILLKSRAGRRMGAIA
jgi:hypothetical protein